MIPLNVRGTPSASFEDAVVGRVTFDPALVPDRGDHVLVVQDLSRITEWRGFAGVICGPRVDGSWMSSVSSPIVSDVEVSHLAAGDVISADRRGFVRTLYRRESLHNSLLATEQCNSLCLMCSQPPKKSDDAWRIQQLVRVIRLICPSTAEIGITGGEPTLLKDGLVEIIRACKEYLPCTALHILSNGRLFYYGSYARAVASVRHPNLMVGIPVYSDIDTIHDHVVQARGAFDETLIGLQNLGRFGVQVEVRVVIHRLTYERLPELAEFLYRNATFASHVAFMGLEIIGFGATNIDQLWLDPADYSSQLEEATLFLVARGINVSVYNHQLCTVPRSIWPYCRDAISDWKNEFLPVCGQCAVKKQCGGFFAWNIARRVPRNVAPCSMGQNQ